MNDFWQSNLFSQQACLRLAKYSIALLLLISGGDVEVMAQVNFGEFQPGRRPTPEQMEQFQEMRRRGRGRGSRFPQPNREEKKPEEKKPEKKDDKKGKKGDEEKKEEGIKTIKRPTDGTGRLDPNRMRLKPDANGLIQFNYSGQPWAEVLQEFADAAKFSFDWQELPADSLNLVTQRKYTLSSARDLLNRHLLARGFTLVVQGEVLTAVKIDKLDPSLVPRVEADDLEDYPPHDFVRVRFQLPLSMDPAKASEDVKVLLSPNAKITPLLNTKRLLVIDSVANLRSVRDLFYSEQTAADSVIKPEIYQIKHRRADYIADQVMIVLGRDPASRKSPQELQIEQQKMRMLAQMQKKGKDISKIVAPAGPDVHIAVDRKRNRLLINADPVMLPTIERTIMLFDVPVGSELAGDSGERSMRRHKTTSGTDAVVTALIEMGTLDPLTQLQGDAASRTIFAYATNSDHQQIEKLIGKLDGSGRSVKVIWLHRLPARQVAGTIMALLVGKEDKEQQNNSSRRGRHYYGGYDGGYYQPEEETQVGFRAMPDVEKNRLLLWANADELAEVEKLLVELGEKPGGQSRNPNKVRVLGARSPEETARLLERLKAAYPGQLNIDAPKPKQKKPQVEAEEGDKVTQSSLFPTGSLVPRNPFRMVQLETARSEAAKPALAAVPASDAAEGAPPINIVVSDDGKIIISSDDPAALDQLEDLMGAIEPPKAEYKVYELKYISAFTVVDKLREYFAEELKGQTESVFDEWGYYEGERAKDMGGSTLGKRPLLRFVYDSIYTNTVVVQNASASQLLVIEKLIEMYDKAPKRQDYYARMTDVIQLKYSRAQDIANSLKEVYRELLSSKDKEFQDREGNSPVSGRSRNYVFGEVRKNKDGEESPVIIAFDGVLSIGVDSVSNTLIVSAREEVLTDIKKTVELLDQAAIPDTEIRVHRVRGSLPASQLQQMLKGSLSTPWPGGKPLQAATRGAPRGNNNNQRQRNQQRNNNRRRRGR